MSAPARRPPPQRRPAAAPAAAAPGPGPASWRRPPASSADDWTLADGGRTFESDEEDSPSFFSGPPPPALDLTGPDVPARPVGSGTISLPAGAPASAGPAQVHTIGVARARALGPGDIPTAPRGRREAAFGLFRAIHETTDEGLDSVPVPSAKELNGISKEGLLLLFDARRLAEITRPRSAQDDVRAAQFLKAQSTLGSSGWANTSADAEFHSIFFGCQVVFRPGQTPAVFGTLLRWAIPFAVDHPKDISKTQAWSAIFSEAAVLYPQLEAEVYSCRGNGREYNLSASLLAKIRDLGSAYFSLRASSLLPALARLGPSPLALQAKAAIHGYVQQAITFPETWDYIDTMIQHGALRQHGSDPALSENAARVAIARPLLMGLLQGQTLNWGVEDLVQAHVSYQPSATLLHSTDFARLTLTLPAAAALASSLPPVSWAPAASAAGHIPAPALPTRLPAIPPATVGPADSHIGPRPGSHGSRSHPLYFSGEYPAPPGWAPPPSQPPLALVPYSASSGPGSAPTAQSGQGARSGRASALSIPSARPIVGSSSPFFAASPNPCDYCGTPGHAQYECPRRFADTYNRPLPGFTMRGDYEPSAWMNGDLVPAARMAMASFFHEFKIPAHRRFRVTMDHIASGTAPPPPGP